MSWSSGTAPERGGLQPPLPPPPPAPKRGGIHARYGVFLGGSDLNDDWTLAATTAKYKFANQRRHSDAIGSIESALRDECKKSSTEPKFQGHMEVISGSTNELTREEFVTELREKVRQHGQQSFYAIETASGVKCLFDISKTMTTEEVIRQYELRLNEPAPVLDPSGDETPESVIARRKCYDSYEFDDIQLSRTVVKSLVSKTFLKKIAFQFKHLSDFEKYPGSVLFMMALEASHASVARDVRHAQYKFQELKLEDFPGEDVSAFCAEALRLIRILQHSYALDPELGSSLLEKCSATSSEEFNRKVIDKLDDVQDFERRFRFVDPAKMPADADYNDLGPFGVCSFLQKEQGLLIADHDWPAALASKLPQANQAPVNRNNNNNNNKSKNDSKPSGRRKRYCFICGSEDHIAPTCPEKKSKQGGKSSKRDKSKNGGDNGSGKKRGGQSKKTNDRPAWRFNRPADISIPVRIGDDDYHFCTKCKDKKTGKVGFYTKTHKDVDHRDNFRPGRS